MAARADIDPTGLANTLIESGEAYVVIHNLDKFVAAGADKSVILEALRSA